jgi:hypothetical protein
MRTNLRRQNLCGWVCVLSFALHLADTLCPAAYGLTRSHRASKTVTGTPDEGSDMNPPNAAVGITFLLSPFFGLFALFGLLWRQACFFSLR